MLCATKLRLLRIIFTQAMHILHIYKDYYPILGGIENHLKLLAETQAAHGHQVSVLVTNASRHTRIETINGVRVIFAGRLTTVASTPLSVELLLHLARQQPDIIHLHFPYPLGDVAQRLFGRRGQLVISYHSDIVRQKRLLHFYAPLLWAALARAKRIIATSPRYITTSPFLSRHAAKCSVVPLGIELAAFATADPADVAQIRARFGSPLILFVGRFRYYKGLTYLIQAMAQTPGHALLIGGEATTYRADLEACAHAAGVADRLHFLGQQERHLAAFFHAADLFVLPSIERSEAFGIVQIEAQAAALPIVCTELGTGTSYVTQHGVTGFVVPPADSAALAQAIQVLLANPELARRMGLAGQSRARQEFSHTRMVERIDQVYEAVMRN
ncbi:MAG: glycosyltransferase [Chloroflexales bacterium]|nr:glycosyltransferase [Chloroflexales bacterium]